MNREGPFFPKVLVIGLGLIGGSFALALRQARLAGVLLGRDAEPRHARWACRTRLVDGLGPGEEDRPFDLLFLAVPPGQVARALAPVLPWVGPDTLVMDGCSVKDTVACALRTALGPHPGLLPAHPIAGGHGAGPRAARADLFHRATVVLTPLPCTREAAIAKGEALWNALGARTQRMDPEGHDRQLALLSHLPHLLAYALVNLSRASGADLGLAGPGFRDATRLALCPAPLWADIALANRAALAEALVNLSRDLASLRSALDRGDRGALADPFSRARECRRGLFQDSSPAAEWPRPSG